MTKSRSGFSLVELLVTLVILAMVVSALMVILAGSMRSKVATESQVEAQQAARITVDLIARDIRSAGYGVDRDATPPQPAFAYVDSTQILLFANLQPVPTAVGYRSSAAPSATGGPLAPDPGGSPLPAIVNAGAVYPGGYKLPLAMWSGGAEMIRYTLDLNDDGVVNATDQVSAIAGEAQRSMNPHDFMMARIVYGDMSGAVATHGNNGGTLEKVGLVRGPGAGVPPLFTVYLGSDPAPWNWANGPVPADRLDEISRVVINVTTESRAPDKHGNYARATVTTEVTSIRNVPEAGQTLYTVDGWVFDDLNRNTIKDAGEPGVPNAVLRLGTAGIGQTNASGYYIINAAPGSYMLRQEVPEGYGAFAPDSFAVNFLASPTNVQHSFADTAKHGGWITDSCWVDDNANLVRDPGELPQDGVAITVNGVTKLTNGAGAAQFFAPPGAVTVTATAPDSMYVVTPNPLIVTMTDGGTARADFGLAKGGTGTVTGKVYRDANKNGTYDLGEGGMPGVWVAITKNAGVDVLAFSYTDASGNFSVVAPSNDPPHVTPYQLTYQVPSGYYATSSTAIQPIWLATGAVITDQNFGVQNFRVITLSADRVLSLGSGELMEKDWSGNDNAYDTKGHKDQDLILGSEWVSNPNISVWFNQWPDVDTLFKAVPTYQRNAMASALALAVGPIDNTDPAIRPDVVTGLQSYAAGNIAVWLTKNSSGNFGYLGDTPTYYKTQDAGDVNAVLLTNCDDWPALDFIAGTKSAAGQGTIEVWTNNGAGLFTRDEIYPPNGAVGVGGLGEVRGMALGDFDADGDSDLVVVTKTSENRGRMHLLEKIGTTAGARYAQRWVFDLTGEGNAVVVCDVDGDGLRDIMVGTKTSDNAGRLEYWRNGGSWLFSKARDIPAPGIVLALSKGDFGGVPTREDVVVGYRDNMTSYTGGIRIFMTDLGMLPSSGVDPAGGTSSYMTPALKTNHFNSGANPDAIGPRLLDLAGAQKPTATTGQVVLFVR